MIKQFVPQEMCLHCKGCCRFATQDSVWQLHLLEEEQKKIGDKIRLLSKVGGDGFLCSCLDERSNKCTIYESRPFECRLYPFVINRRSDQVFLAIDLNCPFAQGKLHSPQFKEYLKYLVDFLESPLALEILKNNPQVIQPYDEVFDLAELRIHSK